MTFEANVSRGQARVMPAGSVVGWWCVMDGKRVVEMAADIAAARLYCQSYNGREACSEMCADTCPGAPDFPGRPLSRR